MRKMIYVSASGNQWRVNWQGKHSGYKFNTKSEAIRFAHKMVDILGTTQVDAIKVQQRDGTLKVEWSYSLNEQAAVQH